MIGWIGIALLALGYAAWRWLYHLGETSFSGDAGQALVIPVVASWVLMATGALLILIRAVIWLFHHINFH